MRAGAWSTGARASTRRLSCWRSTVSGSFSGGRRSSTPDSSWGNSVSVNSRPRSSGASGRISRRSRAVNTALKPTSGARRATPSAGCSSASSATTGWVKRTTSGARALTAPVGQLSRWLRQRLSMGAASSPSLAGEEVGGEVSPLEDAGPGSSAVSQASRERARNSTPKCCNRIPLTALGLYTGRVFLKKVAQLPKAALLAQGKIVLKCSGTRAP